MECPYCDAELVYHDYYGKRDHNTLSGIRRTGDIFKCPNHEGFDTQEEAEEYALNAGYATGEDLNKEGWEEIVCDSAIFNGCFYTDANDNLREGYPC